VTFAAAVPGPDGQPLDQIRLAGVSATGHHGVLAHERAEGQVFSADVVLHLDTRAAASSDDLERTVSYADVAQDVHDVLAGSPADLVETVAERIAAVVLARPAVHAVDVRVHKPQAPIPVPFDDVEVVVRRDRSRPPVVPPVVSSAEPVVPAEPVAPAAPEPADAVSTVAPAALGGSLIDAVPALAPVPPAPVPTRVEAEPPAAPESEPAAPADPLDVTPAEPVEAVLALGANLGDAQVTLRQAVTDVDRLPGVQVMEVSPLARTAAVGGPEQPDYLNAVLVVRTMLSPRDLLRSTQQVEAQHGRVREERWGPRTLDVDIVQYGSLVAAGPDLELPHPRARERAFVLVPWAEVAPDALLPGPGGGPVGQLAVTAPDRSGIRWLALDWLTGPTQSTGQVSAGSSEPAPSTPVPQSAPADPGDDVAPSAAAYPGDAGPYGAPAPQAPAFGGPAAVPGPAAAQPVAEPYSAEPDQSEPYQSEPQVVEPPAAPVAEPRREDPPADEPRAAAPTAFAPVEQAEPDQPVTPRPFAPLPTPAPGPPVAPEPVPAPESFAPPAPPAPTAPSSFAPEQYAPEQYAPEQYAPEQYVPEQQYSPQPLAPGPVRHAPVPPAPQDTPPAPPDAFAPVRDEQAGRPPEPRAHAQEWDAEDDR
jgi:dihydroneopterin aldolase / 2-amino-4-hydroxy-6-hydroxymethyldihydropteridine diphosphokinase